MSRVATNRIILVLASASLTLATGCPPTTRTPESVISGVVDKAPVSGARVTLRYVTDSFEDALSAETGRTNDDGEFAIDVTVTDPTIEVCATDGTYTDEATGQEHAVTSPLCAVLRDHELETDAEIRVTPYTSFVTAYAKCLDRTGRAASPTAAHDVAIAAFDAFLTIGAEDYVPSETEPFPVTTSLAPSLTPEVWAGLLHAGLSQAALRVAEVSGLEPGNRVTASTLTEAIVQDLSDDDCVLDGIGPNGQLMQGDVALNADTLRGGPYGLLAGMLEFADYGSNASGITAAELRPILAQMARFESPLFGTITRQPDLLPPIVEFLSPDPDTFNGTFTGTVDVTVLVEDDSEIVSCAFRNFQPLSDLVPDFSEDRTRCTLTGSFNAAELGEGPLTLVVEARDEIGNLVRAPLEGIVDNTPPAITVTSPLADSTVSGTVTIEAVATDPSGILGLTVLEIGVADTVPANDTFSGSWDTTSSSEGPIVVVFEAEDANGLIGRLEVPLTIDNLEGRTFSGNVSLGSPVSAPYVRVTEYESGALIAEGEADDDGAYNFVDASAYVGPVKVTAGGGTYVDVATGATFENAATLEAVAPTSAPGDDVRASVNAATSLAASLATVLENDTPDGKIEAANEAIRAHIRRPEAFALLEADVASLHVGLVNLSSPAAAMGLFHAGLSRMAADLSVQAQGQVGAVSPDQVLAVLQSDIRDGVFNGRLLENPLSLSLAAFADSYTLRRSLAVATHLFITNAPLVGVDEDRNLSGVAADALRPVGSFYDDIALNDDPRLFPTSAIPLPFDEIPPSLSVVFQAPHAAATLGDALNGDVRMRATATDGSALAHVTILAPALDDEAEDLANVQVVFTDDVLPNIDVVAPACGVDPTLAPYSLLTDQVCGCFEAEDVLGNVSREMLCFTRPPPQIVRLSPDAANGDILDGPVDVEFQVIGGFALTDFDILELDATSPTALRRQVTVPVDHVDAANAPNIVVTAQATDLLGRVSTEAFQFSRSAPVITVTGVEPGELLQDQDLPRAYDVSVLSGYPMTSCRVTRRFLGVPPLTFENAPMTRLSGNRTCVHSSAVGSGLNQNGASEIVIDVVDVTGRETTLAVPYTKDSRDFQAQFTSPAFDLVTNEVNVAVEGTATDSLASVQLTLINPGGGETTFDALVDEDAFSFTIPSNAISTQGTYSLVATSTSTTAQTHTTAALNFTIDRTAPTLVPRSTQPTVRNMDVSQPKTVTGTPPDVTLRPAGVEAVPNWENNPSFAIWLPLTNDLSHTPRYVVEANDNFTNKADIEIRYRIASSCSEPTPTSPLASAHFSIVGSGALDVTSDISEVNLAEAGTRQLCLTAVATDRAGNVSSMISRQFSYTTVPPPVFIEVDSPLYDSASNPLDFDYYSDDYERLFQNFAVPNSLIEANEFCEFGEVCPRNKIPYGFAFMDAVVVNPWSIPVSVRLGLSGYQGAEVRFRTRVIVLKSTIEAGSYWGDNPAVAGASIRNPRHVDATRAPSVPTQENTPVAPNTPLPRWETACTSPASFGARIGITPPSYPLTTPVANLCVSPGNPLVQNFSGRGALIPLPIITQETEQTSQVPSTLRQGQNPDAPRFFELNADGSIREVLNVPVQIPIDENGSAVLLPGQRAVVLWMDSHGTPQESLFDDLSSVSPEMEQFCPLLNAGALTKDGEEGGTVIAADPREPTSNDDRVLGRRPVFKTYGAGFACGTFVLAANNNAYSCTEAGARCYIDRSWREMTSLSVQLHSPTQVVSTTTSDSVNATWSGPSHAANAPLTSRSMKND